jgi:hypothetical protein
VLRPGGHDGLPVKPGPCPASPIFGHTSPIMDRRLAAARECQSDGRAPFPFRANRANLTEEANP